MNDQFNAMIATMHDPYASDTAPDFSGPSLPTADDVFTPEESAVTLEYHAARAAKRGDNLNQWVLEYIAKAVRNGIASEVPDAELLERIADLAFKGGRHGESHDLRTIAELIRMGAKA